ncbi:hypothetical protein [uncultured Rhizobium sp.]|uniref:hypothetical protein n=1 Tax=uncultured Rhizobium sp. TaxID=155567 RepID=UPI002634B84A|nr:hypothetical protein [uncultured Rhizobium sp.]
MRVLSFSNFSKNRTLPKATDWSQQEIADFYRAHRLLVENGAGIGIDRGLTDIGEPWLIFYDLATQDVFMHVARIDSRCVLVCETLDIRLAASTIADLVLNFESAVREHMAVRTERNSNVVLHPAARIIMSISAIFLLFKLDNSTAHAKGMAQGAEKMVTPEVVKKSDPAVLLRAQSAMGRLLDTVDSPRAVASLAGTILTGELLINIHAAEQREQTETAHLTTEKLLVPQETTTSASHSTSSESALVEHGAHVTPAMQETESQRTLAPVKLSAAADNLPLQHVLEASSAGEIAKISLSPSSNQPPAQPVVQVPSQQQVAAASETSVKAEKENTETTSVSAPESIKTLQALLGQELKEAPKGSTVTIAVPLTDTTATKAPAHTLDISLNSLDHLDGAVGFYMQTNLGSAEVLNLLKHFMDGMGLYEIEYSGGRILVEQDHIADHAGSDIGLWTNVMSDGSTISVVGQAHLIDDVASVLS